MKRSTVKYARWQSRLLIRLICLPAALLLFVLSTPAQGPVTSPIGGPGGAYFNAPCEGGRFLAGIGMIAGDDVDSIRPLCAKVNGPNSIDDNAKWSEGMPDGSGDQATWYGAPGGRGVSAGRVSIYCPKDRPIVTGLYVYAEGEKTVVVSSIHLFCGLAAKAQTPNEAPSAVFDAHKNSSHQTSGTQRCPVGLIASGIHGRAGRWVDAVGLICGELPGPPPQETVATLCDRAREARARNYPDWPEREAKCTAATKAANQQPVGSIGRVKVPPTSPSDPAVSICERARQARARKSPAAPNLEAQCRAASK